MISVVLPVYNRAALLPVTLRSLLRQQQPPGDIIVVDDGSTDNSVQVARSFGEPVRVICQANQGPAAARNRGLAAAQGDWVHFFDSDDLAFPNLHAEQLEAVQRSGADIAFSPWLKCRIQNQRCIPIQQVFQRNGLPGSNLIHALLTNWSVVPICSLVRTRLARQVGGFPVELRGTEDQLFFLRLLLAGGRVIHTPDTLVIYRADNPGKLTSDDPASRLRHLRQWAAFLLLAHTECCRTGLDPSRWFDYRLRVWDARTSLQNLGDASDQLLLNQLCELEGSAWQQPLYRARRSLQRKGGGLTWRLFGRRAHRSFRCGPVRPQWQQQLNQLA